MLAGTACAIDADHAQIGECNVLAVVGTTTLSETLDVCFATCAVRSSHLRLGSRRIVRIAGYQVDYLGAGGPRCMSNSKRVATELHTKQFLN